MRQVLNRMYVATCLGAICLVALAPQRAFAQESRPAAREHSLEAGLNFAIDALKAEARKSLAEGKLVRDTPTYAADYGGQLPPELLNARMTQRLDDDAFVDAYVRWQLTSFSPKLPHLSYADFDTMLSELPALAPNPRASEPIMLELDALSKADPLTSEQRTAATQLLARLDEQVRSTESLNEPAREFRAWLRSQLPDTGRRAMLACVEACAAQIAAGYPIDDCRARLLEMCSASAADPAFQRSDRGDVIRRIGLLTSNKRVLLVAASIEGDRLKADFAVSAIYDRDIRPCMRSLDKLAR